MFKVNNKDTRTTPVAELRKKTKYNNNNNNNKKNPTQSTYTYAFVELNNFSIYASNMERNL